VSAAETLAGVQTGCKGVQKGLGVQGAIGKPLSPVAKTNVRFDVFECLGTQRQAAR